MRVRITQIRPAAAVIGLTALLAAVPAAAGVTRLEVPVRGMTCALCTRGVEESIKSLGGVTAAADLAGARVRVEATDGRALNVRDVKERILNAGFGIGGEVEATAAGRFLFGPDRRLTFRLAGGGAVYQVLENDMLRRAIRQSPGLKGDFLVTFRLHEHPHWKPPAIALTGFEPRPPSPAPQGR
jgi:copper chaperone CopZ